MAAPAWLVARRGVRRGGPDPAAGGRRDRLPRRSRALPRSPPGRRVPRARRDRDAAPRRTLVGVRDAPLAQPAAVEPRAAEVADAGSPATLVLRLVPAADARRPPVRARLLERALPEAARRALERLVPRDPPAVADEARARDGVEPERARLLRRRARARRPRRARDPRSRPRAAASQPRARGCRPRCARAARARLLRGVRGHADPLPTAIRRSDQVELPALHHPGLGGVLGRGVGGAPAAQAAWNRADRRRRPLRGQLRHRSRRSALAADRAAADRRQRRLRRPERRHPAELAEPRARRRRSTSSPAS